MHYPHPDEIITNSLIAMDKIHQIVVIVTTDENVTLKSVPSFCISPLITNRTLNLYMLPYEYFLDLIYPFTG